MCADLFINTGATTIDVPMKDFHLKLLVKKPWQSTHTFEDNFFEMLFIFHL